MSQTISESMSAFSGPGGFSLVDIIPLARLQELQDAFAAAHGVSSVITDLEGNWITRPSNISRICQVFQQSEVGLERCHLIYRQLGDALGQSGVPAWQSCLNCGLVEAGVPVIAGDWHVANWLIGQVNTLNIHQERVEEYAWLRGVDVMEIRAAYAEMPVMPMKRFEQILHCLSLFVQEMTGQAYQCHFRETDLSQYRRTEKALYQKNIELARTSTRLQLFVRSFSYDLQLILKNGANHLDERGETKPGVSDIEGRVIALEQWRKIRRLYRKVLDVLAEVKEPLAEVEQEMVQASLERRRRTARGIKRAEPGDGKASG